MSFETAVLTPVSVEINRGMAVCPHTEIRKIFEQPLRQALVEGHDLRVDVSKVDTVQTAMLSHLVYAARRLDKRDSRVILVGASESLIDMLRMCRLDNVIHVEANSTSDEFAESF